MRVISLPARRPDSPGGTAFGERTTGLEMAERQAAALAEIRAGNVPEFLRHLVPVTLRSGRAGGGDTGAGVSEITATIWVSPDYLAIGSDDDFLRWPVTWPAAQAICRDLGMVPATTRIADAVWAQAAVQLEPQPIPPSAAMMSNPYFQEHQRLVEEQRQCRGPGQSMCGRLTAGHKKDVVLTSRLRERPGKVAIYGWHYPNGEPIQPLSTVHIAQYADYSHGLRLVHPVAVLGGIGVPAKEVDLLEALGDPALAPLFSDEGVIEGAAELLAVVVGE